MLPATYYAVSVVTVRGRIESRIERRESGSLTTYQLRGCREQRDREKLNRLGVDIGLDGCDQAVSVTSC